MKHLIYCIVYLSYIASFAQDFKSPTLPRFSVRGNVGIPKVVSSTAFRNSFSGVITGDLSVNCKIFSNFFLGVGYSYTYFKSQKYFRDLNVNTNTQMQNGYMKIGYDKFFNETKFATFSLNTGYNSTEYGGIVYKHDSLKGKYPSGYKSYFVEPMVGMYFIVDPNFAIGAHLSYYYTFSQFDPRYPNFDKFLSYSKLSNNWNTSLITLGFGFYYGLAKK